MNVLFPQLNFSEIRAVFIATRTVENAKEF